MQPNDEPKDLFITEEGAGERWMTGNYVVRCLLTPRLIRSSERYFSKNDVFRVNCANNSANVPAEDIGATGPNESTHIFCGYCLASISDKPELYSTQ